MVGKEKKNLLQLFFKLLMEIILKREKYEETRDDKARKN